MKKIVLLITTALTALSGFSQKAYWKAVSEKQALSSTKVTALFTTTFKPTDYRLYTLDEAHMQSSLAGAALRGTTPVDKSSLLIPVPTSQGSTRQFRIVESPVMEAGLQARYSNIRSYVGLDVADASVRIYFDFTAAGFHAMIISPKEKTIYINPIAGSKGLYSVFDRGSLPDNKHAFDCKLDEVTNNQVQGSTTNLVQSDANLRSYRFAVSTGGEFSQLCLTGNETTVAQKKASVLSVLVTDLVRTNGIYETDFGIHLNYVSNEDTIIFLDGSTDPYQSNSLGYITGKWNRQAQSAITQYIGTANYDIGHLLMGYPTGGNAGCVGCVCNASNKGSGVTGFTDDLTTDPFVVDFWDHEIGHQFGGNHTFDYSYEGTIAQMEPGSGSTIMGYAGTTGANDIQPHSDPYFHAVSIQQIDAYTTTGKGNTCGIKTATGNIVPLAGANSDYTIPKSTPFVLTGTGSDGNSTDSLTYCWEQYDVFKKKTSYKFPEDTSTTGPVFRSLDPTVVKQRYFPALPSVLDGTNRNEWEVLPAVARTLNFRLTVRDNHPGGGSTSNDDMVVTVDKNSGPFKVTSYNSSATVAGGSQATITWNVAGSNAAPVSCTNVKILLSTNGGVTFPTVLVASAGNTGSAKVTIPNTATTSARIMIMSVGNIFFDVNDADFTITSAGFAASDLVASNIKSITVDGKATVLPNPAKNYTTVFFHAAYATCNMQLANAGGKTVYAKLLQSVAKGATENVSLSGLSKGTYFLKITTEKGTQTEKIIVE